MQENYYADYSDYVEGMKYGDFFKDGMCDADFGYDTDMVATLKKVDLTGLGHRQANEVDKKNVKNLFPDLLPLKGQDNGCFGMLPISSTIHTDIKIDGDRITKVHTIGPTVMPDPVVLIQDMPWISRLLKVSQTSLLDLKRDNTPIKEALEREFPEFPVQVRAEVDRGSPKTIEHLLFGTGFLGRDVAILMVDPTLGSFARCKMYFAIVSVTCSDEFKCTNAFADLCAMQDPPVFLSWSKHNLEAFEGYVYWGINEPVMDILSSFGLQLNPYAAVNVMDKRVSSLDPCVGGYDFSYVVKGYTKYVHYLLDDPRFLRFSATAQFHLLHRVFDTGYHVTNKHIDVYHIWSSHGMAHKFEACYKSFPGKCSLKFVDCFVVSDNCSVCVSTPPGVLCSLPWDYYGCRRRHKFVPSKVSFFLHPQTNSVLPLVPYTENIVYDGMHSAKWRYADLSRFSAYEYVTPNVYKSYAQCVGKQPVIPLVVCSTPEKFLYKLACKSGPCYVHAASTFSDQVPFYFDLPMLYSMDLPFVLEENILYNNSKDRDKDAPLVYRVDPLNWLPPLQPFSHTVGVG